MRWGNRQRDRHTTRTRPWPSAAPHSSAGLPRASEILLMHRSAGIQTGTAVMTQSPPSAGNLPETPRVRPAEGHPHPACRRDRTPVRVRRGRPWRPVGTGAITAGVRALFVVLAAARDLEGGVAVRSW